MQTDGIIKQEMLQQLASMKPEEPAQDHKSNGSQHQLDIEKWITEHGLIIEYKKPWQEATIYVLHECPFNKGHNQGEARIIEFDNGALSFGCFHSSCDGHDWHALRDLLEPGWQAKQQTHRAQEEAEELDAARTAVSGLAERVKTDKGAPFEPEMIKAMCVLRDGDPPFFARLTDALKKSGISMRELFRLLKNEINSETEPEDENEINGIYSVNHDVIYQRKFTRMGLIYVPLCNFNARIIGEKTFDDGAERKTVFTITGVTNGRHLPQIQIPAERFSSMNWVTPDWGGKAIVHAGFGTRDHLRAAMQLLSGTYECHTVFGHLGWRKIGDKWYFLNASGGISDDGLNKDILVELPLSKPSYVHMGNYNLSPPPNRVDLKEPIKASLTLLNLATQTVTFPILAAVYRVPLSEAYRVDFSIFLAGKTGSQKTELTAIAQAHYGSGFHAKSLPGNWSSTDNALEKEAFLIKDSIFTIDDFVPRGTTADVQRLHQKADRVLRAQGNLAGRERMRPDGRFQPQYFPRGLIIASGEDVPMGQSLRSRMLIAEVRKGSVNLEELTRAQEDAANGLFAKAMSGYVRWLAPQIDELKKILPGRQRELRTEARKSGVVHDKTPEIIASLAVGWEIFLQFAEYADAISADEADKLWDEFWVVLSQVSESQSEQILSEEPTRRFMDLLVSSISSGLGHIADPTTNHVPAEEIAINWGWRPKPINNYGDPEWTPSGKRIGWVDGEDLFLDPDSSFAVVQELARQQGTSLHITQQVMWARLAEKGLIASREPSQGRFTIRKQIAGVRKRVIHLKTQDLLCYTTGPSGPNEPETEKTEGFWQHTSSHIPPRRKQSGPQSGPHGSHGSEETTETGTETCPEPMDNGSDAVKTGPKTTEQPASGPLWTNEKEEVVHEKEPNTSEKPTYGPNGPLGPLFREDSSPEFSHLKEDVTRHGEFCDCTDCCPEVDPWE